MTIKLMVVDDNEDLRYLVIANLKKIDSSYEITEAVSGKDCLDKLEKADPEVILLDVMMPGMDGMDATVRIREHPKYKDLKILYLTAKTDELTKSMASISGDDFIAKPVDPVELDKRIKAVLAGK